MFMAERMKNLRKKNNLTQEDLAAKINISPMSARRWEWEQRSPRAEELQKLAEALNTTSAYLLGETDDPRPAASKGEAEAEAKAPAEAQVDANQIKLNFSTDMNEPSYKDFSTTTRGNLRYKFKDGSELEVPNTPEMAAQFWELVREIRQTQ